jgi:hypothetical protein
MLISLIRLLSALVGVPVAASQHFGRSSNNLRNDVERRLIETSARTIYSFADLKSVNKKTIIITIARPE